MIVAELAHQLVVVGVDGSPASLAALAWAGEQAGYMGAPLETVTVWPTTPRYGGAAMDSESQARSVAASAVASQLRTDQIPPMTFVPLQPGRAEEVLLTRCRNAALLVVGLHGRHSINEHLLGSVTEHLLAEAACPVAVIRPQTVARPRQHRVVVGVHSAVASVAPLRWAVRQAARTAAKVHAVLAWDRHVGYGVSSHTSGELEQRARAEAVIAGCVSGLPAEYAGLVSCEVVSGDPLQALLTASQTADLVVVGNNRPGHLTSHLLGSVSRKLATQATVPVVVTHSPAS